MKEFIFQCLSIFVLILATGFSAIAQNQIPQKLEQPKIVRAVAPSRFPVAAYVTRAQSKIVVEVKINSEGIVENANFLKGHKLFKKESENAAKKWLFNSIEDRTIKRTTQISFSYVLVFKENEGSEISFNAPDEIEIKYKVPDVVNLPLKRRNK